MVNAANGLLLISQLYNSLVRFSASFNEQTIHLRREFGELPSLTTYLHARRHLLHPHLLHLLGVHTLLLLKQERIGALSLHLDRDLLGLVNQ